MDINPNLSKLKLEDLDIDEVLKSKMPVIDYLVKMLDEETQKRKERLTQK